MCHYLYMTMDSWWWKGGDLMPVDVWFHGWELSSEIVMLFLVDNDWLCYIQRRYVYIVIFSIGHSRVASFSVKELGNTLWCVLLYFVTSPTLGCLLFYIVLGCLLFYIVRQCFSCYSYITQGLVHSLNWWQYYPWWHHGPFTLLGFRLVVQY